MNLLFLYILYNIYIKIRVSSITININIVRTKQYEPLLYYDFSFFLGGSFI